jgi:hypothetical protein
MYGKYEAGGSGIHKRQVIRRIKVKIGKKVTSGTGTLRNRIRASGQLVLQYSLPCDNECAYHDGCQSVRLEDIFLQSSAMFRVSGEPLKKGVPYKECLQCIPILFADTSWHLEQVPVPYLPFLVTNSRGEDV